MLVPFHVLRIGRSVVCTSLTSRIHPPPPPPPSQAPSAIGSILGGVPTQCTQFTGIQLPHTLAITSFPAACAPTLNLTGACLRASCPAMPLQLDNFHMHTPSEHTMDGR